MTIALYERGPEWARELIYISRDHILTIIEPVAIARKSLSVLKMMDITIGLVYVLNEAVGHDSAVRRSELEKPERLELIPIHYANNILQPQELAVCFTTSRSS